MAACDGDDGEALAADGQPALQRAEPVDVDVDVPAVEPDAVAVGVHLGDGQPVGLPAVAELDDPADVVRGAGPPAAGRGEEGRPLQGLLGVGDVDRHLDQRDGGVPLGVGAAAGAGAVQPGGVGGAGDDLRAVEQGEQEGLRRRPAADARRWCRAARRAAGRAPRAGRGPRR